MQKYQRLHAHDDVQWAVDRGSNACAWVTCVEKGGQACKTSYVCRPVLDSCTSKPPKTHDDDVDYYI